MTYEEGGVWEQEYICIIKLATIWGKGNFGIIKKFDGSRVSKRNLGQLEGTFLLFFKTCVHFCYLRQLEGTKVQLSQKSTMG